MQRLLHGERPRSSLLPTTIAQFYREEFLRHRQCLEQQREFYSERAILDAEAALARILAQLDRLCVQQNAAQVVSCLLRKIDLLTGLSAFSDRRNVH